MLIDLACELRVTSDELLGLKPLRSAPNPKVAWLLNRLERLAELPPTEQRAVPRVIDGFLAAHGRAEPAAGARRKAQGARRKASRVALG